MDGTIAQVDFYHGAAPIRTDATAPYSNPYTLAVTGTIFAQTLAEQVPAALREVIESQHKVRFDRAHLKTLDLNWIEFEMVYFMLDPAYALFMDTQQAILLGARRVFDELGVTMTPAATHFVVEGSDAGGASRAPDFSHYPRQVTGDRPRMGTVP